MVTSVQQNVSVETLCSQVEQSQKIMKECIEAGMPQGILSFDEKFLEIGPELERCRCCIKQIYHLSPRDRDDEKKVKTLKILLSVWGLEVQIISMMWWWPLQLVLKLPPLHKYWQPINEQVRSLHNRCNEVRCSVKENKADMAYHFFCLQLQMDTFFGKVQEWFLQMLEFDVVSVASVHQSSDEKIQKFFRYLLEIKGQCKNMEKLMYLFLQEERGEQESEPS